MNNISTQNEYKSLLSNIGKSIVKFEQLDMRRFYILYPIWQTVSAELSWSHYIQLISVESGLARSFYEKQCLMEKWSVQLKMKKILSKNHMCLSFWEFLRITSILNK
ncbi:MAG: DUF1016 N-terminal domain-containing protein [Candidatus Gracilibacteria bacterium]